MDKQKCLECGEEWFSQTGHCPNGCNMISYNYTDEEIDWANNIINEKERDKTNPEDNE